MEIIVTRKRKNDPYASRRKYDFAALPVYDSEKAKVVMEVPMGNYDSLKNTASRAGKKLGRKFTCKKIGMTVFVWRVS